MYKKSDHLNESWSGHEEMYTKSKTMTIADIIRIVCGVCGIRPEELENRSRKEPLPTARALIAHFLYRELNMMPREILPYIGYPSCTRTTVYYYLGRKTLVETRSPHQKDLRRKEEQVKAIIDALKNDGLESENATRV